MNNESWICFACRRVARRPANFDGEVRCPTCGELCRPIGDRIPVPPRDNERAWAALRESLEESDADERGHPRSAKW